MVQDGVDVSGMPVPASDSRTIPMICSSVNRFRFMTAPLHGHYLSSELVTVKVHARL